jgi:hypothetical protein
MFGYAFVVGAVAVSAVASAVVWLISSGSSHASGVATERSFADIAILGIPVAVAALPLVAPSGRAAVVTRGLASLLLFAWALFLPSAAIFYMPAVGLMVAATVMAACDATNPSQRARRLTGKG